MRNLIRTIRGTWKVRQPGLGWGAGVAIFAVLAVTPLFRGLYFRGEQWLAMVVVFSAAAALFVSSPHVLGRGTGQDRFAVAVGVVAAVSSLWAVDPEAGLRRGMLMLAGVAVYWSARHLGSELLRSAVAAGGVATWLAGLAVAAGYLAVEDAIQAGRLASTLQYPNSSAAYWSVLAVLGVGYWLFGGTRLVRTAGALFGVFGTSGVVLSQSRGGILAFAAGLVLLWALMPRGYRMRLAVRLTALLLASVPVVYLVEAGITTQRAATIWAAVALAVAAGAASEVGAERTDRLMERRPGLLIALAATAAVLSLALGAIWLPDWVVQRLRSISLEDYSAWERLRWTRDALRMVRERPLLGWGGGGWNAAYKAFQSYDYNTRHVHNDLMEWWIETGTVGLVALLGFWAAALHAAWRALRSDAPAEARLRVGTTLVAALVLALHSVIDFNLQLGALLLSMWALLGALRADTAAMLQAAAPEERKPASRASAAQRERRLRAFRAAVGTGCALAAAAALVGYRGHALGEQAVVAFQAGRMETAQRLFSQAIDWTPWVGSYYVDRATTVINLVARNRLVRESLKDARHDLERAVSLEPYNANYHTLLASYLINTGEAAVGVEHLEKATKLNPFEIGTWENLAAGYVLMAKLSLEANELDQALAHARSAIDIRSRVQALAASIPAKVREDQRIPVMTPRLALNLGEAYLLTRDTERARPLLELAAQDPDPNARAEALFWMALAADLSGQGADAQRLRQEVQKLNPRYDRIYDHMLARLRSVQATP